MGLTKGLFILPTIWFVACIVTINGQLTEQVWTRILDKTSSITDDEIKSCGNEMKETCLPKVSGMDNHDRSLCVDLLALYECYDDEYHNATNCNDDMQKSFWEKELQFLITKNTYRLHCQDAIQLVEEKIRIAYSLNCTWLLSLYKRFDEQSQNDTTCDSEIRKHFWEKEKLFLIESDRRCQNVLQFIDEKIESANQECKSTESLNCTMLLSLYKRFDEQSQNDTTCDTEMRKYFWSKEKLFLSESTRQCQNVIQFIDEKISNADKECKSTDSLNCTMLLSFYKRFNEQSQNDTTCDTEHFWEKEKLFLSESDRQCQNVIQFIDEKIENADQDCNSTDNLNCTTLLSFYKRYDEQSQNGTTNCDTEMHFWAQYFWSKEKLFLNEYDHQCENVIQFMDEKISNSDKECNSTVNLNCTWLLSFYERYDGQSQNGTNYDTMLQRAFWENEKLFLNESSGECQNVIQFIDEKIKNSGKPNGANAFVIQSTVIGAMTIISVLLKNMAVFDRLA